ncbi:MAG: nicotinate-nucleotide--dimethylbenzimidazole phosphoribosyltransferase [Pseudomonadota bacterium]
MPKPEKLRPISPEALQSAIDNKTKPPGSLGRIEQLAIQISSLQQSLNPTMHRCGLILFAADHGVAQAGVSRFPQEVTGQMVRNFLQGGAAANVFAESLGVNVQVVDAGVAGPAIEHSKLTSLRIGPGTKNFAEEPAMTDSQLRQALEHGRRLGSQSEFDALCFGEMGIANTSSATMLFHKLLSLPIGAITGHGTGLDNDGLQRKIQVLVNAAQRTDRHLDARSALVNYGGFEIAMMTGAMLGAAEQRRIVIVDGFIASAAAACAINMDSSVRKAMVFAHQSAEQGHAKALDALNAKPLLQLDMRLGEGTGALLAWPLVKSAAAMLNDMASFDSAGISDAT